MTEQPNPITNVSSLVVRHHLRSGSIENLHFNFQFKAFPKDQLTYAISLMVNVLYDQHTQQTYGAKITLHYIQDGYLCTRQCLVYFDEHLHFADDRQHLMLKLINIRAINTDTSYVPTPPLAKHNGSCFLLFTEGLDLYIMEYSNIFQRDWAHQALQHITIQQQYTQQFKNHLYFIRDQLEVNFRFKRNKTFILKDVQTLANKFKIRWCEDSIDQLFFAEQLEGNVFNVEPTLTLDQMQRKFQQALVKDELRELFGQYSQKAAKIYGDSTNAEQNDNLPCMTKQEFIHFMMEEQNEQYDQSEYLFEDTLYEGEKELSFICFSEYLFSVNNEIVDMIEMMEVNMTNSSSNKQEDPMDRPLNEYFINSAQKISQYYHVTNRLWIMEQHEELPKGLHGFVFVLRRGARYLDIEIWEGDESKPMCAVGPMQNQQVALEDVLQLIKSVAFEHTTFPLILNITEHCNKPTKSNILQMFRTIFGEMLIITTALQMPTAESLRNKVVLTGPVRMMIQQTISSSRSSMTQLTPFLSPPSSQQVQTSELDMDEGLQQKHENIDYYVNRSTEMNKHRTKNFQIHHLYQEYTTKSNVNSPGRMQQKIAFFQSEVPKIIDNNRSHQDKILRKNFLLIGIQDLFRFYNVPINTTLRDRGIIYETTDAIYIQLQQRRNNQGKVRQENSEIQSQPTVNDNYTLLEQQLYKDSRLAEDSLIKWYSQESNAQYYNPQTPQAFLLGVQLTMMMHHIIDFNYMYHYAMFRGIDGVERGFVLKPEKSIFNYKRGSASAFSMASVGYLNQETQQQWDPIMFLSIKLISGRFLLPTVKLQGKVFVQIILRDPILYESERIQQDISHTVEETHQVFKFDRDFVFELSPKQIYSVLMFIVYEAGTQKVLCWNSIPLRYIRQGYRVVPLLDEYLNRLQNANLMTKIKIK